jgi:glycerophosphoryl diester phosphodiesterase
MPKIQTPWPSKTLLLGHRGARALAPENTLPSFALAMERGADGVELDVYLSKDKILVINHDDTVNRTTDGKGNVFEKTVAELQKLNAAKGWPNQGVTIPTLVQLLDSMSAGSVVNVELKGEGLYTREELADTVLTEIAPYRKKLFIILSGFDSKLLEIVRKKDDKVTIGLLFHENGLRNAPALKRMKTIRPDSIHIPASYATPKVVKNAHEKGIRVMIWTVNDQAQADQLFALGVDGVFSDLPAGFAWTGSKH